MTLEQSERELERGDRAPEFSLPSADGETYSLSTFADREALLIAFTCDHCPYAKTKIDALNGIAADYADIAVIGINPNDADAYPADSLERMEKVVEEGIVDYDAYLRDRSQDVARAHGATCTSDPFLFANDGAAGDTSFQLTYHGRLDHATGPGEEPSREPGFEMREAIDRVLAGETVDDSFRPSRGCSIKWQ